MTRGEELMRLAAMRKDDLVANSKDPDGFSKFFGVFLSECGKRGIKYKVEKSADGFYGITLITSVALWFPYNGDNVENFMNYFYNFLKCLLSGDKFRTEKYGREMAERIGDDLRLLAELYDIMDKERCTL